MGIENVRKNALQALLPLPNVPLADWIESSVYIPASASALPGRMQIWPFQRGWCEAIEDPEIERITILKGARIGYTQWLSATLAHFVANAPAPIIALQPTTDDARDFSVELESLFEASPTLRGLLSDDADESGRSTMLARRFPGGSLKFLAAKSPRNLRRHTTRFLAMDEIDGYEVTQEGDPIKLAEMRTLTFRDRKILAGSTPVFDFGPISRLYSESDKRVYECRCSSCGEYSEVTWASIQWKDDAPDSAHWVCPKNGCFVEERFKPQMVAQGRWRATAPEVKDHAGFAVNCLISPHHNARWGKLAAEFLLAKRAPETLQIFTNTVLGQPWKTEGEDLDEHELFARREAFISTPTPVIRRDAAGPFAEILPPEAFELATQSLPVLDSHNTASVRAILGQTLSIRREGDSIVADMRLSSAEDVAPIGQRIADGTLSGVSIGYRVVGWAARRKAGQRIKSARGVHLTEVTLTSNPADPNAGVRQAKDGGMPKDVQDQEDDRSALIARVRAAHNLPEDWANRMADAEDELTDDEIRANGRETALAARAARPQVQIRAVASSEDPAVIRNRQVEALSARMMGTAPTDAARPFMQMELQDFARDALVRAGQSVATLGREELMTRAIHTTSDFSDLLTGAGNRVLANAYQQAQSPLKELARQRTVADFRPLTTLKLGEFSGLQKVSESGEIKSITTGEAKESCSLETFGGIFSLSRKAIISDDLSALPRSTRKSTNCNAGALR